MDAVPAAAILLSAGSVALFALVGRTIQKRPVSPQARSGQVAFVTWWYGIAALSAIGVVQSLPGFPLDLTVFLALTVLQLGVLCVALSGLLHYLVFLYTDRRNAIAYIAFGYALFFGLFLIYLAQSGPSGVEATRWGPELQFDRTIDSGPLFIAMVAGLIGPPVVAAAAYLRLYRVVGDPMLQRRILLVGLSVIVWFGSSLIGTAPGAEDADWWRVLSRVIGLAAAAVILYAYAGLRPSAPDSMEPQAKAKRDSLFEQPKGRLLRAAPLV